eukprot:9741-Chlamydomonas_euryale.AAC.5
MRRRSAPTVRCPSSISPMRACSRLCSSCRRRRSEADSAAAAVAAAALAAPTAAAAGEIAWARSRAEVIAIEARGRRGCECGRAQPARSAAPRDRDCACGRNAPTASTSSGRERERISGTAGSPPSRAGCDAPAASLQNESCRPCRGIASAGRRAGFCRVDRDS